MAKKYDESEGVWRTIGGRRVFIKTGQSLADAMRDSGKFVKRKGYKNEDYQKQEDKIAQLRKDYRALETEVGAYDDDEFMSGSPAHDELKWGLKDKEDELREAQNRYREMGKNPYVERKYGVNKQELSNLKGINKQSTNIKDKIKTMLVKDNEGKVEKFDMKDIESIEDAGKYYDIKYKDGSASLLKDKVVSINGVDTDKYNDKMNPTYDFEKEVEYVAQDGKVHKMMSYDYPEERDEYHKFLQDKYGTYKEEEIKDDRGRTDYKKLRREFYDEKKYESDVEENYSFDNSYWNGKGKYKNYTEKLVETSDEELLDRGIPQSVINEYRDEAHRYYRWFNDGDKPHNKTLDGKNYYPSPSVWSQLPYYSKEEWNNIYGKDLDTRKKRTF